MLLFRSEEHIVDWCSQWKLAFGASLSLAQGWQLAQAWYSADRRARDWHRKPPAEIKQIFNHIGLWGDFWRLE